MKKNKITDTFDCGCSLLSNDKIKENPKCKLHYRQKIKKD